MLIIELLLWFTYIRMIMAINRIVDRNSTIDIFLFILSWLAGETIMILLLVNFTQNLFLLSLGGVLSGWIAGHLTYRYIFDRNNRSQTPSADA